MRLASTSVLCLFLALFVPCASSAAQVPERAESDEEARRLFEAGEIAFHDGRYEVALSRFRESYDLSHRPELLYNIASCLSSLERDAEAIEAFEQFLAASPDSPHRSEVEDRLTALRASAEPRTETEPGPAAGPGTGDLGQELWWLWTLLGVGAAAAIVIPVVVVTQSSTEPPLPGDLPSGVIVALEVRP